MMPFHSFLQTPEWERLQQSLGRKTWRVGGALVIRHDLPMGFHYLYAPRFEMTTGVLEKIGDIAAKEGSIFLKADPLASLPPTTYNLQPSAPIQPRETIVVDLTKSEDTLLAALHEKTRYNIRLAERKGVRIKNYQFPISNFQFNIFWNLLEETAARDEFRTHSREYYEKLLAIRSDDFSNELFFAEHQGQMIAAALVNFYAPTHNLQPTAYNLPTATYLHGASAGRNREVMAPHLLHWRIILEARRRGCAAYDLWGIDEEKWPGLTRFKKGFGGRALAHPASVDMIYRARLYAVYSLWKRFFST